MTFKMALPILRACQITKTFVKGETKIPVLKGIDLTLHQGECVAIMGPSGAGKSTLLHILGTLEPATKGELFYGTQPEKAQNLFTLSEDQLASFRNKKFGFVFQFHYLLPEFTALENVMMPARIGGYPHKTAQVQAQALLEFVGLSGRLNHYPHELSGGEQQRVAIARAVILNPNILLADELTGNLDSENGEKIMNLLKQLNEEKGISILLVTHDQNCAKKMHRIIEIKDGVVENEIDTNSFTT